MTTHVPRLSGNGIRDQAFYGYGLATVVVETVIFMVIGILYHLMCSPLGKGKDFIS